WGWLREAAGTGRHVVRVSFGAQGEPPATDGMTGEEAADLARAEAEAMLGVALPPESVRAHRIARFAQSQPAATRGRQETADAARARIAAVPGLGAAGAWLAGTGLAQVVPDALAEAERMRHLALWEGGDEER
ncbi:MAG: protoporphyrinogen oxidase, partial [Microbacterium sp.]